MTAKEQQDLPRPIVAALLPPVQLMVSGLYNSGRNGKCVSNSGEFVQQRWKIQELYTAYKSKVDALLASEESVDQSEGAEDQQAATATEASARTERDGAEASSFLMQKIARRLHADEQKIASLLEKRKAKAHEPEETEAATEETEAAPGETEAAPEQTTQAPEQTEAPEPEETEPEESTLSDAQLKEVLSTHCAVLCFCHCLRFDKRSSFTVNHVLVNLICFI